MDFLRKSRKIDENTHIEAYNLGSALLRGYYALFTAHSVIHKWKHQNWC